MCDPLHVWGLALLSGREPPFSMQHVCSGRWYDARFQQASSNINLQNNFPGKKCIPIH